MASAPVHYRHTQIGWVTLVALGSAAVPLGAVLGLTRLWGVLALAEILLLVFAALFATLTVEVDDHRLTFRFGLGLIRKRIELADIRRFVAVTNPWWYGWGIHLTPRGVLYNVSGLQALELHLRNGKTLRLGTDEPEALGRALERVLGPQEPLTPLEATQARQRARRALLIPLVIAGLLVVGLGVLFAFHERPPAVTLTADRFRVTSVFYSEDVALAEITRLALEERLPHVRLRTNGYAAGGTLRGHFRLEDLGDGQLFIEADRPPYIVIQHGTTFVAVGFEDPAATASLYRQLQTLWLAARRDAGAGHDSSRPTSE